MYSVLRRRPIFIADKRALHRARQFVSRGGDSTTGPTAGPARFVRYRAGFVAGWLGFALQGAGLCITGRWALLHYRGLYYMNVLDE